MQTPEHGGSPMPEADIEADGNSLRRRQFLALIPGENTLILRNEAVWGSM
jgi:hypothetical protein